MIHVFPMLTTKHINPSVLPGVCKSLEMFILTYRLDAITTREGKPSILLKGAELLLTSAGVKSMKIVEASGPKGSKTGSKNVRDDKESSDFKDKKSFPKLGSGKKEKVDITMKKEQAESLTIQPTWVNITTPKGGSKIVGIKVVPFQVSDDRALINLMTGDIKRSGLDLMIRKYERGIAAVAYKVWYASLDKILKMASLGLAGGRPTISGDPKTDIILQQTDFKNKVFVMLNKMDFDEGIFDSVGGIKKLYSLGWNSMLFADDQNTRAIYCMKEFGGICTGVPYNFLYSSVSQQASKVYEDMTDIKKASGPIFRTKVNPNKLFGESLAASKKAKFGSPVIESQEIINEGLLVESLVDFKNAVKSKSIDKIIRALSKAPVKDRDINKFEKEFKKENPDFDKSFKLSKQVIDNSLPELPPEVATSMAKIIATKSVGGKGNSMVETRKNLKNVVGNIQKKKDEPKIRKESIIAILFIIITFAGIGLTAMFGKDVAVKTKDVALYQTSIILIHLRNLIPAFLAKEKKIGLAISKTYEEVTK